MHRSVTTLVTLVAVAALAGCAATAPDDATPTSHGADRHGQVSGAQEVPEAPLALLSVDAEGAVGVTDLLDGDTTRLGGLSAAPEKLHTDGRYAFVTTAHGVEVIDSGRWTWDHVDHFHYYRAHPRLLGTVSGAGTARVATGLMTTTGSTGIFFEGSGEAVLLPNEALAEGEIVESFRVATGASRGLIAPLGDGALVAYGERLVFYEGDGTATHESVGCAEASGAVTTHVGLVVGCREGVVLATWDRDAPAWELIAYPPGVSAERAVSFEGRKGRPTVAAVAGDDGFWLLDTRERTLRLIATDAPLLRVAAVDDAHEHVVALDAGGRVRVYAGGEETAVTEPVVGRGAPTALTVDAQRAYVGDADAGIVREIDFADGARVARTIETVPAAEVFAEVGR
jgi:hypothetical protein